MFAKVVTWAHDQLVTAGINSAIDPADLNTPGVWITPATATRPTLDDQTDEVTLTLYLVAGSVPAGEALDQLDTLTTRTRAVLQIRTIEAVQISLPNHNPAGLPAYRTTLTLEVKETTP